MRLSRSTALVAFALLFATALPARAHDWNEKQIAWRTFDEGAKVARREHKPILLVVFTEWCPHCRNFSRVFQDPRVVSLAKKFVMIHVDMDREPDVSHRYAPDGEYIPRTYFLTSKAVLDPDIHADRRQFAYFYDESDAAPLVKAMQDATAALRD